MPNSIPAVADMTEMIRPPGDKSRQRLGLVSRLALTAPPTEPSREHAVARKLDFPVFDADNHMYETTDAFTKYLPAQYDGLVKYVQVNGRTKIALRNVISEYIPNPTFSKVAPPGAQELEFRLKNPHARKRVPKEGDKQLTAPPRYIESPSTG